jgi:Tfp pilus assembly protein FimT
VVTEILRFGKALDMMHTEHVRAVVQQLSEASIALARTMAVRQTLQIALNITITQVSKHSLVVGTCSC